MFDLVTIQYSQLNKQQIQNLQKGLEKYEKNNYRLIIHDNSIENLGFAKGSNRGAKQTNTEIIGFINPDVNVHGRFISTIENHFLQNRDLVITGCAFRSDPEYYQQYGLDDWVCGASFFVRRQWFFERGGFDERYEWSWEETDLCLQAVKQGLKVESIDEILPLEHYGTKEYQQTKEDLLYKEFWLDMGGKLFKRKWGLT